MVLQALDGGPHGAARVKHVVDEDDVTPAHIEGDVARPDLRIRKRGRSVVTVERDIDGADGRRPPFDSCDLLGDAGR